MSYSAYALGSGIRARRRVDLHSWYAGLLCVVLAGYAVIGKGFAYIGVPPLYIGEIALLLGLIVVVRTGSAIATLTSPPSALLAMLIAFVTMRTMTCVGPYGVDALRDSVVVLYGLFAFVVIALLLERPERLVQVLALYARFAWFYGLANLAIVNANLVLGPAMPNWPWGGGIPILFVRLGEGSVHLAGAVVFALLGLRRVGLLWALVALVAIAAASVSRGAMLASLIPIAVVAIVGRQRKRFGMILAVTGTLFALAYAADLNVRLEGGRVLGPEQIVNGLESVVGSKNESNLEGTKEWRLNWWHAIVDYTVHGRYFWTGKGFGVNLAEDDGFVVGRELGGPPVRSPHNVNMTILARTGVPGIILWIATILGWFAWMFRMVFVARRHQDHCWSDVFLWIACYGLAIVVDSSFDVAMEGPMVGIWFWCLFGLGIGATMIYRTTLNSASNIGQRYQRSLLPN